MQAKAERNMARLSCRFPPRGAYSPWIEVPDEQLDEPIYASTSSSRHLLITIEIPTTDEPLYRAFFTELAHLSDRPISL